MVELNMEGEDDEGLSFVIEEEEHGQHAVCFGLIRGFLNDRPIRFNAKLMKT